MFCASWVPSWHQTKQKKEQQIQKRHKEKQSQRGWQVRAAKPPGGERYPDPDERKGQPQHGREEQGVPSTQRRDPCHVPHRNPIVEQPPRTMKDQRGDDAIKIVFQSKSNQPHNRIRPAVDRFTRNAKGRQM